VALLTPDQIRQHIDYPTGDDADQALQRWLDAAERDIIATAGSVSATVETHRSADQWIYPYRAAAAITSAVELVGTTSTTLAANDHILRYGGWALERLVTGTNARGSWAGTVTLTYTGIDDLAVREAVQVDLVRLDVNHAPGLTSRTIGDWSETYASNSVWNLGVERARIIERLIPARSVVLA